MKQAEPRTSGLPNKKKIKQADNLSKVSRIIASDTMEALDAGKMDAVQASGHIALSKLLEDTADGTLSPKQSTPILKSLAERKTPDPVQRIQTHQTVDMRAIILQAVEDNPDKLQETLQIAIAAREQVKQRIGAPDNALELKPVERKALPNEAPIAPLESTPITLKSTNWNPGESPPEITKLQGGTE